MARADSRLPVTKATRLLLQSIKRDHETWDDLLVVLAEQANRETNLRASDNGATTKTRE